MKNKLIADLHIHSRFSMATSKSLNAPELDFWARHKGIDIMGTGDITHPLWLKELSSQLQPAHQGLYELKNEFKITADPAFATKKVHFILTGEISSIYKHKGRTRKIHNIFILPDLDTAAKFQSALEAKKINIRSDGRPICGLSARNLLETALEVDDRIFCIPAHIWTPWFSLFGAKSGYDQLQDCFEDLSDHITTLETGLSADVPMIRLVSALDKYSLISSSDAHSPSRIGRNATLIEAQKSYSSLINALQNGKCQTIDTYPQAGKYHYDGHRKCGICWHPSQTDSHDNICSVCGKPVTIGVLNRVYQLADREQVPDHFPITWKYIMPLPQIISRITKVGENSKTVQNRYRTILAQGNSELDILLEKAPCSIDPEVMDYITRFQSQKLDIKPGFDGQYGSISLI